MIRILTTNFNTTPYIHKLIHSLKEQSVKEFKVFILDDLSTDDSVPYIQSLIEDDDRFELIINKKKMWQVGNYEKILKRTEIDDEDICITVDGDDYLYDSKVLERVLGYYNDPNILMTFGQFVFDKNDGNFPIGFTKKPITFDNARKLGWCSSHLRTFKAHLFRKIKHEDLIDERTNYYPITAGDVFVFSPMMEMAGEDRVLYTTDLNYCYNVADGTINDYKLLGKDQIETARYVANKPKYQRIP